MAWTTIDQLTPNNPMLPLTRDNLRNGRGTDNEDDDAMFDGMSAAAADTLRASHALGALYYADDIIKVVSQPDFGQLEKLNVRFDYTGGDIDGPEGEIVEITALVARESDGAGGITENVLPNVALPWPPYYKRRANAGTEIFEGEDRFGPDEELEI